MFTSEVTRQPVQQVVIILDGYDSSTRHCWMNATRCKTSASSLVSITLEPPLQGQGRAEARVWLMYLPHWSAERTITRSAVSMV